MLCMYVCVCVCIKLNVFVHNVRLTTCNPSGDAKGFCQKLCTLTVNENFTIATIKYSFLPQTQARHLYYLLRVYVWWRWICVCEGWIKAKSRENPYQLTYALDDVGLYMSSEYFICCFVELCFVFGPSVHLIATRLKGILRVVGEHARSLVY